MNLVLQLREPYLRMGHVVDFKSLFIHLYHSVCSEGFKRDSSLEYYSHLFHSVLASTVQTHVPVPVIM